jgi:ribosomal protein S18 acetylase RimI-like enzyme
MIINEQINSRPATSADHGRISNLIYFEPFVHRHLDWRAPLDWLGAPEYWVTEQNGRITSVLACPPDPEKVAWIRLFARTSSSTIDDTWNVLWETASREMTQSPGMIVAAIAMHDWFRAILRRSNFEQSQNIVLLDHRSPPPAPRPLSAGVEILPITEQHLPQIAALDAQAFAPLWRNSLQSLRFAYAQAGFATMAVENGQIIGYQLTTRNAYGAHLARLAVHPNAQGRGIGFALLQRLLQETHRQNIFRLTVNTQSNNQASLNLYQKTGFVLNGEQYPVFTYSF